MDHSDLAHHIPCNATKHDLNTTISASQVITASYALLFYLVILVLSILGVCFRACVKVFSSQASFLLFLIGTLMVSVNIFTNSGNQEVKIYFRLATGGSIGIIFVMVGAYAFFSKPEDGAHQSTLGRQQPSMGLVVGWISGFLIFAEIILIGATIAFSKKDETSEALQKLLPLVIADKFIFLFQKIVQASIYIAGLRYRTICPRYKENARFYLKILAFYNFSEWVDSQVNEESDFALSPIKYIGAWFDVFAALYKALIIDYRLSCSLLFLEHSLEDEEEGEASNIEEPMTTNQNKFDRAKWKTMGWLLGFTSLSAPMGCILYYVRKPHMPAWVQIFAIIVNLAIAVCVCFFLRRNDFQTSGNEKKMGLNGVKIMVCCLGAVGFTCWMIKAPISGYWAAIANERMDIDDPPYFAWVVPRYAWRAISTAFLMGLFLKVDLRSLPLKNPDKINHFLVPLLIWAIFAAFFESVIDQYVGPLDSKLRCELKELSLDILFEVGPPMYLGFLIHMLLHCIIIQRSGFRVRSHPDPSYVSLDNQLEMSSSGSFYQSCEM